MSQKTDLNVAPYYDDYSSSDNFVKTLFRPGFAIQARELTQLQSQLQSQIEAHGTHMFKEGAMIIPGQIALNTRYNSLKLTSTFSGETIDPSQYYNATTPVTITGATSGVTAVVLGYDIATTTDQPTLYVRYLGVGTDNTTAVFADGENISANSGITHTTSYSTNVASATTYSTLASERGCAATITEGVYYIRGSFIEVSEETLVLEKYTTHFTGRVGLTITETIVTPESDSTIQDNSTGTSNYAAKGAHRLKISVALAKLEESSTSDADFVELMRIKQGVVQTQVRKSEFGVIEDTFARRTYDESGDYITKGFELDIREHLLSGTNRGIYASGAGGDSSKLAIGLSPGKAYVKGYEITKIGTTYVDVDKARSYDTASGTITRFNIGSYVNVDNVYNTPDIGFVSGETEAYKSVRLIDTAHGTRGTVYSTAVQQAYDIGRAKSRSFEYSAGTASTNQLSGSTVTDTTFKHYIFLNKICN